MPSDKPLTLTNEELLKVEEGLKSLDGIPDKGTVIRFDLPDDLCWNCAKNRCIVERGLRAHGLELRRLAAKHKVVDGQRLTEENAPAIAAYLAAAEALKDKTIELTGILKINRKELVAAGVKVPGIFTNLMPILTDP